MRTGARNLSCKRGARNPSCERRGHCHLLRAAPTVGLNSPLHFGRRCTALFLLSSPVGEAFIYFSADRAAKDCAKLTVQVDVSLLQAALAADLCAPMSVGSSKKVSENRKRTTLLCLGVCSRTIGCSTIGPTTNWTFANCMKE